MKYKETAIKVIAECSRLLLGVVFIFSGFVKAVDPVGFAIKIGDYLMAFGLEKLDSFSMLVSFNLVAIEFMLGVCMLLGVYRRYASLLTLLFMAFMTPLTLYLALFDPVSDCGCFGDALILTNWETFGKNVVLLAAAIFAFIYNQKIFQVYTFRVYWFVALWAFSFCILFSVHNYRHLPILDFRPYKIGANIPELMSIPEGAAEEEYSYSFVYEKEGKQQTFSLDDIPEEGSGWAFVESKTTLVKEGYIPPVAAFNLYDEQDTDRADEVLSDEKGVFLLIFPKLEKANDDYVDEINSVYDYALDNGLSFYGVTGSGADAVTRWKEYMGADYSFLYADDILLKTIIRSNPGLVLLKEGTVLGKWHYRDIPAEEEVKEVMDPYFAPGKITLKEDRPLSTNLLTFAVPLLLVWVYDYFRNRRRKKKD
ncbi:putative membrane protein YphA (DoxX/SURF4 family) [Parabacteroides sp. PFB2-10]|uniref:BT_3928 family protein n=1 Tax=Parabacteroides sp. PFB2-10 TaxID=1742405 RepID=UPI002476F5C1|nr:BT_3928 family protein [Parabacteroides sp. PFB2-10]MDH6314153.1 putative membrane protein YphA (DoxX/SURF4 family) [Parabacteroides sp. PFB2-10]MDL2245343.1 DoxX family protein [Parabacteroides sp. OttesenSCG-928-J18]